MACPYFEPQLVSARTESAGRLPLIDEYNGLCQASERPFPVPADLRLRCCNHGNSRGACPHLPKDEMRSSFRYEMVKRTPAELELLLIEERGYAPFRWQTVRYMLAGESLEPEIADSAKQAQIRAFCRSFLENFPA